MSKMKLKPFLKWAGGKGQLLTKIQQYYPIDLGTRIKKYAEPFVGGGALLFDVLGRYNIEEFYISDINASLINTYCQIRDNLSALLIQLKKYQEEYYSLLKNDRKIYYYAKREQYNKLGQNNVLNVEMAALFIFLNKTCFNGLYRVNKNGDFNVPMGAYNNPLICDDINLENISKALVNVEIICADYKKSSTFIDANTFVYLDPPYRPLNATSSFNSYTENDFNDQSQIDLADYIKELYHRGAYVLASNSDPKNINSNDLFFDNLYSFMDIIRLPANRMINSKSNLRGEISELLIISSIKKSKYSENNYATKL